MGELLREELSRLVTSEMHDPRLPTLLSITRVAVSADLRHASVHVSIMGDDKEKRSAIQALKSAAGFLRRGLRPRLSLRYVPELSFQLDESIETGARTLQVINELGSSPGPAHE